MLIAHIRSLPYFSHEFLLSLSLPQLMHLYRESKVRFDADPLFRKESQQAVIELQQGDENSKVLWKEICEVSRRAYEEIYGILHVRIEERGESFYNPWLKSMVDMLEEKGVVEISNGAKCIFVEGVSDRDHSKLPLIIQKSDGGYNYDTTDIAALWHRVHIEKAERIIYVTDLGQATHFQLVFGAGKKADLFDPKKVRLDHVGFGLVLGPDGKKFKTRSGETERLRDLLDAAVQKAKEIIKERNPNWTDSERETLSHILGIGAVKYSDLSCNRLSDYTFSYERMLKFEGNTAAFIMYSYVRTLSIMKKVASSCQVSHFIRSLLHPSERALAKQLVLFNDVIAEVEEQLMPNRLTEYLFSLAEVFNQFFRDCHVEGDARVQDRLFLVVMTMRTLKEGLDLLGIEVPEKM
jgi:arginyl-tRNA synthetase